MLIIIGFCITKWSLCKNEVIFMSIRFLAANIAVFGTILTSQVALADSNVSKFQMLTAKEKEALSAEQIAAQAIRSALRVHDYTLLGTILKANVEANISLKHVIHIAKHEHSTTLLRAANATEAFLPLVTSSGVSVGDYIQMALFIESNLREYIEKKQYFLPIADTGLLLPIEFDPKTKKTFLLLNTVQTTPLNYGKNSKYFQALEYIRMSPQIVARGEEEGAREHEIHMLRRFKKAPGVVQLIAYKSHEVADEKFTALYLPLYNPGSLRAAFDAKTQFSLNESASIALNLLNGLHEIHKRKIVHRNLGPRNELVNIPTGDSGTRTISAVIASFENAMQISDVKGHPVQENPSYVAPEGIFKGKLSAHDYFRTDVYALGLVLYQLFYSKEAPWQSPTYITNKRKSADSRYKKLTHKIHHYTDSRRTILAAKKVSGTITPQENYEYLILRMVEANPEKRGLASALYEEMKVIFASIPNVLSTATPPSP